VSHFSESENQFLHKLAETLSRLTLGLDLAGEAFLTTDIFQRFFPMGKGPLLEGLDTTSSGLKFNFNLQDFSWISHISKSTDPEGPDANILEPKTEILALPAVVSTPFVEVGWKPNDQLLYSWRYKHRSDEKWGPWGAFERRDRASFWLDKPGHYEVQVKAMNRSFEIQSEPSYFEFDYRPLELKRDLKNSENSSPKSSESGSPGSAPSVERLSAKGLFGCHLRGLASAESVLWLWSVLFFFIAFMIRKRLVRFDQ
jgi:hypothetical protein